MIVYIPPRSHLQVYLYIPFPEGSKESSFSPCSSLARSLRSPLLSSSRSERKFQKQGTQPIIGILGDKAFFSPPPLPPGAVALLTAECFIHSAAKRAGARRPLRSRLSFLGLIYISREFIYIYICLRRGNGD